MIKEEKEMNSLICYETGKPNRDYWNIVKGLGAISIVIGHCCMPLQNFVYLYHVPLFFFISGFMYDERKYGDDPYLNITKRMHSWVNYIIGYVIYVLLHNVFLRYDMLRIGEVEYSTRDMIEQCAYVVLGCGDELLGGPLWFVPTLVIASVCLGFIIYFSRIIEKISKCKWLKFIFQLLAIGALALIGYAIIYHWIKLPANIQVALAVLPYLWIGYLLRNYLKNMDKYVNIVVGILCLGCLILYSKNHLISLVDFYIFPEMYIIAFMGMYVMLCFARVLYSVKYCKWLKSFISFCGEESFWLMATHFVIIRGIDRIYSGYKNNLSLMYEQYLGTHNELIPLYLLFGIGIPSILYYIWKKLKKSV